MFKIRYVCETDKLFWHTLDRHLGENELELKIRDNRGYIISDGDKPMGVMRYNLMWDNFPFLTLIHLDTAYHGKGFGKKAMLHWENEMRGFGFDVVMISTKVDEDAQHFYRKLGYRDTGGIFFHDNMPFERPQEMFMSKLL